MNIKFFIFKIWVYSWYCCLEIGIMVFSGCIYLMIVSVLCFRFGGNIYLYKWIWFFFIFNIDLFKNGNLKMYFVVRKIMLILFFVVLLLNFIVDLVKCLMLGLMIMLLLMILLGRLLLMVGWVVSGGKLGLRL